MSDRRVIDQAFRREVAEFAATTSGKNAARHFQVSHHAVRMWQIRFDIPRRKLGNYTREELQRFTPSW